ncbi:MAG: hypothetical protein IE885_09190 [Campylobacterales bacterium]|nr:hypothetical protein [Campylobacterales bacterium]
MKQKIEEAIKHIEESKTIAEGTKPLVIEKLEEWKEEKGAISDVAVRLEKWWAEIEPIFAELGWV